MPSVAIFIVLTRSDTNCRNNAGGNDVAILSGMREWHHKSGCAASFGNKEVKNRCRKSRFSAAANHAASLLEN
jgi:hypothetical protein